MNSESAIYTLSKGHRDLNPKVDQKVATVFKRAKTSSEFGKSSCYPLTWGFAAQSLF